MKKKYNKLVRDKIPEIIERNNETPHVRILNNEEFKIELEKKLYEEYKEVLSSEKEERLEELADMIEVIKALSEIENSNLEEVIEISKKKSLKRGSFKKKIYLEDVD